MRRRVTRTAHQLRKALEPKLEEAVINLLISERLHRVERLQHTWDRLQEVQRCFAAEDYSGAMKTGLVIRKLRSVKDDKTTRVVEEYEINTALIESLNSVPSAPLSAGRLRP